MPRLAKRVTSFFPGKGPTESSSASSASSASASSASATSAAAAAAKTNNQVPPRNSIDSTDIDGSSSHLRVNDDDDDDDTPSVGEELTSAPCLSSLLTATSERNLPPDGGGGGGGDVRMILQSAVRMTSQRHTQQGPKKSILKSTTSSISTLMSDSVASGGDAYFTTSSSSSISSSRRGPNNTTKLLSFTSIHVREYPVLIGDNPSVGQGVPLTIGWEPQTEESYQVEDFESNHRAEPVLSLKEMKFTEEERAQIAKNLGYSDGKINKIAHHVKFSTLTRKKKIIRTLHLDVMKTSFRSGLTKVSNSSRKLLGTKHDDDDNNEGMGDDDNGDDRDEMAF